MIASTNPSWRSSWYTWGVGITESATLGQTSATSRPTSCSKQGQLWDQSRLLGAASSWGSDISKDGEWSRLLREFLECMILSRFSLYSAWTRCISIHALFIPPTHHTTLWKAWLKMLLFLVATAGIQTWSLTADFGLSCGANCHKFASGWKWYSTFPC